MGANCTTCQSCNGENEFNDNNIDPRQSLTGIQTQNKNYIQKTNSKYQGDLHFKMNVKKIITIQKLCRAIIARKKFEMLQLSSKVVSKYFTDDEARETLHGTFKPKSKPIVKTYKYKNGAVYNGEWLGGFRHGKGIMKWPDGAIYEGEWNYGQAFGDGKFHHVDGDEYEGQWSNNKANGYGFYTNVKGARYEGYWKDDSQHGKGIETWHEGSRYEGMYANGKKEGFGKYQWADGSIYEGDWLDNRINGKGVYLWKDGRKYYGEWANNDMEGVGVYFWADGRRYEGQYANDKKCGFGIYYWTDGRKYEGWWYKGKQHGLGMYIDPAKGKMKYGLWENGKRVKWFDEQTIKLINQRTFDYTTQFTEEGSANHARANSTFLKPDDLDFQISRIKRELKVPNSY